MGRLFLAAGLAAAAVVIHPRSAFIIVGAFGALVVARQGVRAGFLSRRTWLFLLAALTPALVVYGWAIAAGTFMISTQQANVMPQLLLSSFFWRGWAFNVGETTGLVAFCGALLGTLLHRAGTPRSLVLGMWVGYVALCLTFTYAIATHDYYHLQLVPIVAIAGSPAVAVVVSAIARRNRGIASRLALLAVFGLAAAFLLVEARNRTVNADWQEAVAEREHIGAVVGHSSRTIMLAGDYGVSLEYHGLVAGTPWPLSADLEWEQLAGLAPTTADERFARYFAAARPEYFIVEDLNELALQPDLAQFLLTSYPVLSQGGDYVIYKLESFGQ